MSSVSIPVRSVRQQSQYWRRCGNARLHHSLAENVDDDLAHDRTCG
jgi:hypothetical protein